MPLRGTSATHPEIGLGLWNRGRWTAASEGETTSTIEWALDQGMRWFDTAEVYGAGRSERILGEVLERRPGDRRASLIVSKVSWEHLRAAQVRAAIQGTLERIALPSIDLYLVHAPDDRVPIAETMGVLAELADQKRIGAVGVSNFTLPQLEEAEAALAPHAVVVNQVRYNLLEREDGDPLREHCRAKGIWIEAYSPLAHGLLAGRYLADGEIPAAARRGVRRFDPEHLEATLARARALDALAKKAHIPLASLALHWLRRQGALPLFGATQPTQIDANLSAWATSVPEDVLEAADALTRDERA
ncbi:MAG: aldo/keto reductase [Thermoplasmata archaeon]